MMVSLEGIDDRSTGVECGTGMFLACVILFDPLQTNRKFKPEELLKHQ
jgi:hypothetical protein